MLESFKIWSKHCSLYFVEIDDPSADIIIAFGSGYHGDRFPFDGPGNVLAHAFYPYEMNTLGGDIHFDNDESWKENTTSYAQGESYIISIICVAPFKSRGKYNFQSNYFK